MILNNTWVGRSVLVGKFSSRGSICKVFIKHGLFLNYLQGSSFLQGSHGSYWRYRLLARELLTWTCRHCCWWDRLTWPSLHCFWWVWWRGESIALPIGETCTTGAAKGNHVVICPYLLLSFPIMHHPWNCAFQTTKNIKCSKYLAGDTFFDNSISSFVISLNRG